MNIEKKFVLIGLPLVAKGFVNVTGLSYRLFIGRFKASLQCIVVDHRENRWYRCEDADIVAIHNEVWIRPLGVSDGLYTVLNSIGLNGDFKLIPNREILHRFRSEEIMMRIANPYWTGSKGQCEMPAHTTTTFAGVTA